MKTGGRAKLHSAILEWRNKSPAPDKHAKGVLTRLSNDRRAFKAFAIIDPEPGVAHLIVGDCIKAELNARIFKDRLNYEQRMLDTLKKATDGLSACEVLLKEKSPDPLAAFITVDPQRRALLRAGLVQWRDMIASRRRIVQETAPRIGATRKFGAGRRKGEKTTQKDRERNAAHRAAIGWLADGVKRVTGQSFYAEVAKLAEVVLALETDSLSFDQVRAAYRERTKRDWRLPLAVADS